MRKPLDGGSYGWTVYAPERYIKSHNLFVFKFKEHRDDHAYDPTSWEYPSTPFSIYSAAGSSSSTSSTSFATLTWSSSLRSMTGTSTSDGTDIASTPTVPIVPQPSSTDCVPEFHRIKIASKIAGAVGGSLAGGVAIMLVVYFIRRRYRKTPKHVPISASEDAMKDDSGTNTTPLMAATRPTREIHMGNDLPEWVPPR
ncbi:hypothetical protein A1F94_012636 [Pyrenophora tritici-repentis]|nr:uncharacterized protein PTRG_09596 [Pyrenophora tritici-repentis Pt-1C-BFP]KAG9377036.1 hypothetical protein A1F94_012636 [Pyrenophora tritici-repentis]EDU42647.1 predicted protein [Pyrenophora tritici-repentis Pt-1C-BFP]KAI1511983.1 hypothetical protein Ptr86124_008823 [Pyrenophora tritici-repentis]KAI1669193.1 hypothetical protein L13192_06652 [Pyrenophora tritici-repentis]KAI1683951.1 hypothetical protein KJE20_06456 [Pyrenophora tritici-repentis]